MELAFYQVYMYRQETYYAGNSSSLRHVDATRTSHSNGVTSDHQSCTVLQLIYLRRRAFDSASAAVSSLVCGGGSLRGLSSLKVNEVRFVGDGESVGLAMDARRPGQLLSKSWCPHRRCGLSVRVLEGCCVRRECKTKVRADTECERTRRCYDKRCRRPAIARAQNA